MAAPSSRSSSPANVVGAGEEGLLQEEDVPTAEEVAAILREAFTLFEDTTTHTITFASLKALLETLGQAPTEIELKDLVAGLGLTPADALSYEKVEALVLYKLEETREHGKLRTIFDGFDTNGDGFIDASDLRTVLATIGGFSVDDRSIEAMLKAAGDDCLRTGKVSFPQFKAILRPS